MERMKVLITVKTYPIPSANYDELVCTAGVREDGSFIRLYPINFRELNVNQRFRKYQWIEVAAVKHQGRDARKESFRPDSTTIKLLGEPIPPETYWTKRAQYILLKESQSMEFLHDQQKKDRTSLGIFKPKKIRNLIFQPDSPDWKPAFKAELAQARFWDDRKRTLQPPRKVPFKFQYEFECDDPRCKKNHCMMIEDWEVGALFWRNVNAGRTPDEAAKMVQKRFLDEMCAVDRDTHLYVGTVLEHGTWVVIGVFWPKTTPPKRGRSDQPSLFD